MEAEAILACHVVGLAPGLGIVHSDTRGRQSLALDIMEPVRPEVDVFVLDLLEGRTFRKAEFTETEEGHCRLKAPLTHELAETMPQWARALAPIRGVRGPLVGVGHGGQLRIATPLTRRKSRRAQAIVKARKRVAKDSFSSKAPRQRPLDDTSPTLWTCPDCGAPVTNQRHVRCNTCIDSDPRQAAELRGRRGAAIAARKRALREWEESHPEAVFDPDLFRREILPGLQGVRLSEIMEAAGISKGYASQVRAGKYTPQSGRIRAAGTASGPAGGRSGLCPSAAKALSTIPNHHR